MSRIITLINQKNHYLEKFYSANEIEILNFVGGDFSNLENFYQNREKILEMIKYIDGQIDAASAEGKELTASERKEVTEGLAIKDEYVNRILGQDLEILATIEEAKSSIIRELQDVRKTRKVVGSYRSKTFHKIIDEEV